MPAIASRLSPWIECPSTESAAIRPCIAAVDASIQPPVTSPPAEMRGFVVRHCSSITISPRCARLDADLLEPEAGDLGAHAHADQGVRAAERAPVLGRQRDAVVLRVDRASRARRARSPCRAAGTPPARSRPCRDPPAAGSAREARRACSERRSSGRTPRTRSRSAPAPTTSRCSGKACSVEHVARRVDAVVVDVREGRLPGGRAGGDQEMVVLERAHAVLGRDLDDAVLARSGPRRRRPAASETSSRCRIDPA